MVRSTLVFPSAVSQYLILDHSTLAKHEISNDRQFHVILSKMRLLAHDPDLFSIFNIFWYNKWFEILTIRPFHRSTRCIFSIWLCQQSETMEWHNIIFGKCILCLAFRYECELNLVSNIVIN